MTDESAAQLTGPSRASPGLRRLSPATSHAASLALTSGVLALRWGTEGGPSTSIFAAATCLSLGALVVLFTRRILFATIVVSGLVMLVVLGATIKQDKMNLVMHAYDLVFYLSSWSTVSYLWADYRYYVVLVVVALAGTCLACGLAFLLDSSRVPRRQAALAALVFAAIAYAAAMTKGERRHMEFTYAGQYLNFFFASWPETIETLWRGQLIEAALNSPGPAFASPGRCEPAGKPPHIILLHQESVVPPQYFPRLDYDRSLDSFFLSYDGRLHKMRVETYGGASWLTEFSLLAGVSTYSFGGMRPFVQLVMADKLKETLPQTLALCGYRNVVFYPMLRNFVSNDRFYRAIGLSEIFDAKDQGARSINERDRFYYANALDELERHVRRSSQPLFTFIQTMFTHWPYHVPFMPEVNVAGGGPGTHPEMHEYLRRLAMARADYEFLKSELARRLPNERILIVRYGDHHPMATRVLLGYAEGTEAEDVLLGPDSVGFLTHYAVEGVNYVPPALPDEDIIDVPYLGTILLDAARLPLPEVYRERKRLLMHCAGRYYTCKDRGAILGFHRRLLDSGLVQAR